MKLALLWRGPIRPDWQVVSNRINMLYNSIVSKGHKVDGYFFTWQHQDIAKLITACPWLNLIALTEMDKDLALSKLTARCVLVQGDKPMVNLLGHPWLPENSYKQFWTTSQGIKLIIATGIPYDGLMVSRPDAEVIIENLDDWLIPDTYVMPSTPIFYGVNDQLGVGSPHIVQQVWNIEDLAKLNLYYGQAQNPEHALSLMIQNNNIKTTTRLPTQYTLHGQRWV